MHPGVDTELFCPRAVPAPAAAPLRITVLGRVQPLKGQDLAVRAAIALAERDPALWARCEFIIAGEPTPGAEDYAASLRVLAQQGGIADRVRFLPAQDRIATAQLLAESSVVVVPSHSESFGLVALEAAASGVPAVVAAHTGLLEASPPTAELRVAGREPEVWADAIAGVLQDPAHRATLGRVARSFALAHNWDAHAQHLLEVYDTLG